MWAAQSSSGFALWRIHQRFLGTGVARLGEDEAELKGMEVKALLSKRKMVGRPL